VEPAPWRVVAWSRVRRGSGVSHVLGLSRMDETVLIEQARRETCP
jgi:hypothetical protein